MHFISFVLIYSLWLLRLRQRANVFFHEGHLRRYTVTLKWLTFVGSSKLGSGGAPNAGRIDTIVSTIAITGMKMASKSASKSYLVNLNTE